MFKVQALAENKEKIMQKARTFGIREISLTRSLSDPNDYVFLIKCQEEGLGISEDQLDKFKAYLKDAIESNTEVTLVYKENLERGLASYKDTSLGIAEAFFNAYESAIPLYDIQSNDLTQQLNTQLEKNRAALLRDKSAMKRSHSPSTMFTPAVNAKSPKLVVDSSIGKEERVNQLLVTIEQEFPDIWECLKGDTQQTIKLLEQQVEAKKASAYHLSSSTVIEQRTA